MHRAASIDVEAIVESGGLSRPLLLILVIAALALVSDGFDVAAIGIIAPELAKDWGIGPSEMVPAFSAGIIGMMIGGPLLGLAGDRFGRRRAALWGLLLIGVTTLLTAGVQSIDQLVVLRLLTGIGLGGVIPNIVALVAELTPARLRGRVLACVILGMVCGTSLPGLVAAVLVPKFGWQALLLIGGILPLLVAGAMLAKVPESLRFLIARGGRDDDIRRLVRRLRPDIAVSDDAVIIQSKAAAHRSHGSVRQLFAGNFILVTPLLWICQAANQMSNFFALTWLPTLLQSGGASTAHAGAVASLFALGGLIGGLLLIALIDRLGLVPLLAFFVLGAPLVALMAASGLSPAAHAAVIAASGLCVTGINIGLTALLGIFHPTPIRALGTGWTQAAGRIGALAAPVVGGLLLGMGIPLGQLPLAPAAVLGIGALACTGLVVISLRRFGNLRPQEFPLR